MINLQSKFEIFYSRINCKFFFRERDLYHTCYALSGLSIAQNGLEKVVIGDEANLIEDVNPSFNVGRKLALKAADYFFSLPVPS